MSNNVIGLVCPEREGYNYCKKILSLQEKDRVKGRKVSVGEKGENKIYAVNSGLGKIKAAAATQLLIDKYEPDLIFDTGVATSLTDNVDIHSVIIGENIFEYDVFSTAQSDSIPEEYTTTTWFGQDEVKEVIGEHLKTQSYENIFSGNLVCGEKKIDNRIYRELLHSKFNSVGSTWDSAAVSKVAQINEVNSLTFRIIMTTVSARSGDRISGSQKEGYTKLYSLINKLISDNVLNKI